MPDQRNIDPNLQLRKEAWSAYWRHGAMHSLCGSIDGGLDGALREFWLDAFSACPPEGRLLDVCTGNGAIPRLACESKQRQLTRIDAVDLASVAPDWLAAAPTEFRDATVFHGGVAVEALPFEAGTFDLVASQFGIEYCESRLAIPELARVAAPGAHLALVLHHAGSRLADVAQTEAASIAWLLAEDGPLAATATIYPYLAMAAAGQQARLAGDHGATRARDQLNNTMQALVERSEQSAYPDILFETRDFLAAQIQGIIQRRQTLEQVRQAHVAWVDQLEAAAFRHRELCTHALDATAARDLVDVFTGEGFEAMDLQPLHQDAYLIGWRLTGIRGS